METGTLSFELDAAITLRYDLVRAIRETLGLPENVAVPMADHLARGLTRRLGGLYIPKRDLRSERDEQICAEFNGRNHVHLARKWGVTPRTIYNVVRRRVRGGDGAP